MQVKALSILPEDSHYYRKLLTANMKHHSVLYQVVLSLLILGIFGTFEKRSGDRSHWCCNVKVQPTNLTFVEIEYIVKNVTEELMVATNRTRPCREGERPFKYLYNILPRCQVFKPVKTIMERTFPINVTKTIQQNGKCPPENSVCCEGYQEVNGQCVDKDTAQSPELQSLIEAGLVFG